MFIVEKHMTKVVLIMMKVTADPYMGSNGYIGMLTMKVVTKIILIKDLISYNIVLN